MKYGFWTRVGIWFLRRVIKQATPQIKQYIRDFLTELKKKTDETPNPFDNILVELLWELLAGE